MGEAVKRGKYKPKNRTLPPLAPRATEVYSVRLSRARRVSVGTDRERRAVYLGFKQGPKRTQLWLSDEAALATLVLMEDIFTHEEKRMARQAVDG